MDQSVLQKENNLRELGGYRTRDGRTVRHGVFYRSGCLYNMNEQEIAYLDTLGIHSIFDFRSSQEIQRKPDPEINGARYYHVSAMVDEAGNEVDLSPKGLADQEERLYSMGAQKLFLENFYGRLPFSSAYNLMFDEIRHGQTPILFHCSAGKDRTGVAAALILLALNVDEETILQDYLLTNVYRKTVIDQMMEDRKDLIAKYPDAEYIMHGFEGVNPEALQYSLDRIKERYNDYPTYFKERFHLDNEALQYLRDKYTENRAD